MEAPAEAPYVKGNAFKVIIAGAGVAGLTLAHSLDKANIDYVVLDKGIVAPPWGISLTIHPNGCRILHQIDCLDTVSAQCTPMEMFYQRDESGRSYLEYRLFDATKARTGYDTLTIERRAFLQILYDKLRDKSKILERSRVENIIEENGLVRVIMADGTEQVGDLVVGADGVHSKVRELMWRNANQAIPGFISAEEKRSLMTAYKALIVVAPMPPGLGRSDMHCVSNDKFSFLVLCQPDTVFVIVHCKLPEDQQCRWPNRARYTEVDMETLADKLADRPLSESVLFGKLWRNRIRGHLISLEEGVLEHWFFGRTVLAGDSVHKFTPNAALGGAMAMESAVSLANAINRAVCALRDQKPSDAEMRAALQRYRDSRFKRVQSMFKVSWMLTRLQAHDGWFMYLTHRWLMPLIGLDFFSRGMSKRCTEATKLDYVPFEQERGTMEWQERDEALQALEPEKEKAGGGDAEPILPTLVAVSLVFSLVLVGFLERDWSCFVGFCF